MRASFSPLMDTFQNKNTEPSQTPLPQDAEVFRIVPQGAEGFGNVPKVSEIFRTFPNASETFRTIRKGAEKTEHHTLTVRESTRLFEQAGVPRTERSIVNWCQQNPQGFARLDAFYDMNERRYFITPQSVDLAIKEEQAKQAAAGIPPTANAVPESAARRSETPPLSSEDGATVKELERKMRDLEIATRAKDYYIDRLETDRTKTVEQLVGMSRYVGELETQLLQLGGAPRGDHSLPQTAERFRNAPKDTDARDTGSF